VSEPHDRRSEITTTAWDGVGLEAK